MVLLKKVLMRRKALSDRYEVALVAGMMSSSWKSLQREDTF